MKKCLGGLAMVAVLSVLSVLAACAGGSGSTGKRATDPIPSDSALTTAQAERAANDAILAAFAPGSGVSVVETRDQATLSGTIAADGVDVSFTNLVLAKRPFSATGTLALTNGSHAMSVAFSHSTAGDYSADGVSAGSIHALIPMTNSFVQATAGWAMHQAWHPTQSWLSMSNGGGGQGSGPCNVSITDDGNGGILLDGSCTVCNATVTFTQLDITLALPPTITGSIAIDDGNGNTALLVFSGTSVDVTVNGQDLGSFDLSQI